MVDIEVSALKKVLESVGLQCDIEADPLSEKPCTEAVVFLNVTSSFNKKRTFIHVDVDPETDYWSEKDSTVRLEFEDGSQMSLPFGENAFSDVGRDIARDHFKAATGFIGTVVAKLKQIGVGAYSNEPLAQPLERRLVA